MSRFNSSNRAGNNVWPDNTELFTLLESNLSRIDEELQPWSQSMDLYGKDQSPPLGLNY